MSLGQKIRRRIHKYFGNRSKHVSETSKVRHLVLPYCEGLGCDIGFGGDKIKKLDCVGIDFATPYSQAGSDKVDIACDLGKENIPIENDHFDYVYSSHLIEDFEDTEKILKEFIRILKSAGNLILVFPDQQAYEKVCMRTGQPVNKYHVHKEMGFDFMIRCLQTLQSKLLFKMEMLLKSNREIDYNVVIVMKIIKN